MKVSGSELVRLSIFLLLVGMVPSQADVEITPKGGPFLDSVVVTMSTSESGATIYYNVNKRLPTIFSNDYMIDTANCFKYVSPIVLKATCYLSIGAVKQGKLMGGETIVPFSKNSTGLINLKNQGRYASASSEDWFSILGRWTGNVRSRDDALQVDVGENYLIANR